MQLTTKHCLLANSGIRSNEPLPAKLLWPIQLVRFRKFKRLAIFFTWVMQKMTPLKKRIAV
jgi:hypothetical protein